MLQMSIRMTLVMAGAAAAIVVTNMYYAQAVECLARMEKLAHAAIPAALAIALLYKVLKSVLERNE